eukprot:Rmarinus@m.2329
MVQSDSEDYGLAIGLTFAAGLSTTIGAASIFFVDQFNMRLLSSFLAISAGVMIYVSFVEIFAVKSIEEFESTSAGEKWATHWATLCFFVGIGVCRLLEMVTHMLTGTHAHSHDLPASQENPTQVTTAELTELAAVKVTTSAEKRAVVPRSTLDEDTCGAMEAGDSKSCSTDSDPNDVIEVVDASRERLMETGLLTALAIGLHNFPEGLATFVATLADPSVGFALAFAIALHNIPEGICVAMPVYYATGSRWKGFMWATLSGVSEPLAAICGYLFLKDHFSATLYGCLFGVVAGMMIYISVRELLPTAYRYDPHDKFVTMSMLGGMMVMAASLLLFAM